MKTCILIVILILSPLITYLEWGKSNSAFLWETESLIFKKLFSEPSAIFHPFILLPLAGQLILLACLFQSKPNRWLMLAGIVCIASLLLFIFLIGILGLNFKVLVSTLPFLITSILTLIFTFKKNKQRL